MKKWLRFFCLSFFSDKIAREGAKRGYTNVFLGLLLAFALLWMGFVGADMLPFSSHYANSPDFQATVHELLASSDARERFTVEMQSNRLRAKGNDGQYLEGLLISTLENEADRQIYSSAGYDVVVDTRPADALAEVEILYVSNNGKGLEISYEEYLALNDANKLNFDLVLRYTGKELELSDERIDGYLAYLNGLGGESKEKLKGFANELAEGKIKKSEYNRAVYELYFTNYYPDITAYESTSSVPLLRNYYYHNYIKEGNDKYLFIFDDYMAASFETKSGTNISFYGFYGSIENGVLIGEGVKETEANAIADGFIEDSYRAIAPLTLYAHAMNVFSMIPFIALMPMVVSMLAYSLLKLRGVESIGTLGSAFKIIGSFVWASAAIAVLLSVLASFFAPRNILAVLPLLVFFVILAVRSIVFVAREAKSYTERQEKVQTEA